MDAQQALTQSQFTFPSNANECSVDQRLLEQRLEDFILSEKRSMASKTLEAMRYDWEWFFTWCFEGRTENYENDQSRQALPAVPQTIIDFIFYWVGLRAPSSIRRCLSHIAQIHKGAGLSNPLNDILVKSAMKKIGRLLSDEERRHKTVLIEKLNQERLVLLENRKIYNDTRPIPQKWKLHHNRGGDQRQAKGLQWHHVKRIQQVLKVEPLIDDIPTGRKGIRRRQFNARQAFNARNRAIAAVAYDTLCRASELISFSIEDIDYKLDGHAHLILRLGKTNQEGKPKRKFVSTTTVAEIEQWLDLAGLTRGPIFCSLTKGGALKRSKLTEMQTPLSTRSLLNIYKTLAHEIGEEPELFSCHSSRVGATQDMVAANISMLAVKQAGDWKSDRMPSRYAEETDVDSGGMAQLSMKQNRK